MADEQISRILKMLEDGKITAADAEKLIAALQGHRESRGGDAPRDQQQGETAGKERPEGAAAGKERSFEFRWARGRAGSRDIGSWARQLGETLSRLEIDRWVDEARSGGKRWQERVREFMRRWSDIGDVAPVNVQGWPTARRTEKLEYDVSEPVRVVIHNPVGEVVAIGGSDRLTLEVNRTAWAPTQEQAAERLEQVRVAVEPVGESGDSGEAPGGTYTFAVEAPAEWRDGVVHLLVRVPKKTELRVSTTFGEVRVENVDGPVGVSSTTGAVVLESLEGEASVETVEGDIRLYALHGPVSASTRSGAIEGEQLHTGATVANVDGIVRLRHVHAGDVNVRTVSGRVELDHIGGEQPCRVLCEAVSGIVLLTEVSAAVQLKTISGDVEGKRLSCGHFEAETVSGDTHLGFVKAISGQLRASSISGDICVSSPEGGSFRYSLLSRSGRVHCDHPAPDAWRSGNALHGTVGDGQGTVSLSTVSGDVSLLIAYANPSGDQPATDT